MMQSLSFIHPNAKIGANVKIEPFVTIYDDVEIGDNTWVGSNVTIMSGTRIGKNCKIYPGAVLGGEPQDLKFNGEYTTLEIGDNVTIREYCTLNRGTEANNKTVVGDNSLLMSYVHVAHDCVIGRNCVLASYAGLAGHVEMGNYATLGGYAAAHQFTKIGSHAFVRGGTLISKDVPPFVKAVRDPIYFSGVNIIGLRRKGFTDEDINLIKEVYRIIFNKGLNTSQALDFVEANLERTSSVNEIIQFIRSSDRGIIKGNSSVNGHKIEQTW